MSQRCLQLTECSQVWMAEAAMNSFVCHSQWTASHPHTHTHTHAHTSTTWWSTEISAFKSLVQPHVCVYVCVLAPQMVRDYITHLVIKRCYTFIYTKNKRNTNLCHVGKHGPNLIRCVRQRSRKRERVRERKWVKPRNIFSAPKWLECLLST